MSRAAHITIGVLRIFPALFLAVALVCAGLAVRDFFFQAADQLVTVQSSFGVGK